MGMILMKLASILLLILTLVVCIIITKLFRLKKLGRNFADLAFPVLVFEYYLITAKTFTHNFLPRLGLALSVLAIILVFFFLLKKDYKASLMCLIIAFIIANAILELLPISSGLVIGAGVLACIGIGFIFPDKESK